MDGVIVQDDDHWWFARLGDQLFQESDEDLGGDLAALNVESEVVTAISAYDVDAAALGGFVGDDLALADPAPGVGGRKGGRETGFVQIPEA